MDSFYFLVGPHSWISVHHSVTRVLISSILLKFKKRSLPKMIKKLRAFDCPNCSLQCTFLYKFSHRFLIIHFTRRRLQFGQSKARSFLIILARDRFLNFDYVPSWLRPFNISSSIFLMCMRLECTIRDFTIYDVDVDENVTSKYNIALS